MTVVDRPDNGQDDFDPTTFTIELPPDPNAKRYRLVPVEGARAGAGEQQRVSPELRRYLTGLAGSFRDFGRADIADELLALLGGPQPDGEAVAAARACWCARCEGVVLAHDHPTDLIAQLGGRRFIVCRDCGDKRCPRAAHHDRPCAYRESCRVYSHGESGWHCAVTGDHDQHTNAAGDVTW